MRVRPLSLVIGAASAVAAVSVPTSAGAITFGVPDGTWIYCSGTLLSPTVFVTAAHCADAGARVRVTFSAAYQIGDKVFAGTFIPDPHYRKAQSDPYDLAVVVFDQPAKGITPARLPAAGSLDGLPKDQLFTSVGFGSYLVTQGGGARDRLYNDVRGVATGTLNSTTSTWLKISENPALGNGGTCNGDSGGPNFLGTTTVLAATTVTGDTYCNSTNVDYRLDTPSARSFLGQFVALP